MPKPAPALRFQGSPNLLPEAIVSGRSARVGAGRAPPGRAALHSGHALAEQGLKVLAVDLDPQGNLTMSQGLNPDTIERSMFDVLVHRLPIQEIVQKAEVDLAVSSIDLAGAELALSSLIGRERALEKA